MDDYYLTKLSNDENNEIVEIQSTLQECFEATLLWFLGEKLEL